MQKRRKAVFALYCIVTHFSENYNSFSALNPNFSDKIKDEKRIRLTYRGKKHILIVKS